MFDPVDGTTNYAHGLPIFCCACSLERNGQPIVAAIYDPSRRELFTAERGAGAWLNGAPMRVSSAGTLIDSLLCTGFPYTVQTDGGLPARALRRLPQTRRARCGGSGQRGDRPGLRRGGAVRRVLGGAG